MKHSIDLKRSLIGALLFGLLATPALAQQTQPGIPTGPTVELPAQDAQAVAARREALSKRLTFLLSGYEFFPDRAQLDREGSEADVVAVLLGFVREAATPPSLRIKSVDALGYYAAPESVEALRVLAVTPLAADLPVEQDRVQGSMRHHAIVAVARAAGERAAPMLAPLLADKDLQIQLTAVSALGKHGGEAGRVELVRLKKSATEPILVRELRKHVP
jgi:hypothetical protein